MFLPIPLTVLETLYVPCELQCIAKKTLDILHPHSEQWSSLESMDKKQHCKKTIQKKLGVTYCEYICNLHSKK